MLGPLCAAVTRPDPPLTHGRTHCKERDRFPHLYHVPKMPSAFFLATRRVDPVCLVSKHVISSLFFVVGGSGIWKPACVGMNGRWCARLRLAEMSVIVGVFESRIGMLGQRDRTCHT